ncbi:MAG: uracil-DNA glycosylase [Candidatus Meridianibacter frigidus]|nr:MAG: uracil-DNA glycosylase [Candidatus Eremiobacteraeota bacterium]
MTLDEISARVVACARCPELRIYCRQVATEKKRAFSDWNYWGKPVPAFGDPAARLMLVGLAPGAHGSNRTGRMFTGDGSGDFLYPALYRAGFASQPQAFSASDRLRLRECIITAAARCAPPRNRPTPQELRNCFPYLVAEFDALPRLEVVVGLGAIGWEAALKMLRERTFALDPSPPKFGHGMETTAHRGDRTITLIGSFHPSRQNTNTGKLTEPMFDAIFARAGSILRISNRAS